MNITHCYPARPTNYCAMDTDTAPTLQDLPDEIINIICDFITKLPDVLNLAATSRTMMSIFQQGVSLHHITVPITALRTQLRPIFYKASVTVADYNPELCMGVGDLRLGYAGPAPPVTLHNHVRRVVVVPVDPTVRMENNNPEPLIIRCSENTRAIECAVIYPRVLFTGVPTDLDVVVCGHLNTIAWEKPAHVINQYSGIVVASHTVFPENVKLRTAILWVNTIGNIVIPEVEYLSLTKTNLPNATLLASDTSTLTITGVPRVLSLDAGMVHLLACPAVTVNTPITQLHITSQFSPIHSDAQNRIFANLNDYLDVSRNEPETLLSTLHRYTTDNGLPVLETLPESVVSLKLPPAQAIYVKARPWDSLILLEYESACLTCSNIMCNYIRLTKPSKTSSTRMLILLLPGFTKELKTYEL